MLEADEDAAGKRDASPGEVTTQFNLRRSLGRRREHLLLEKRARAARSAARADSERLPGRRDPSPGVALTRHPRFHGQSRRGTREIIMGEIIETIAITMTRNNQRAGLLARRFAPFRVDLEVEWEKLVFHRRTRNTEFLLRHNYRGTDEVASPRALERRARVCV